MASSAIMTASTAGPDGVYVLPVYVLPVYALPAYALVVALYRLIHVMRPPYRWRVSPDRTACVVSHRCVVSASQLYFSFVLRFLCCGF